MTFCSESKQRCIHSHARIIQRAFFLPKLQGQWSSLNSKLLKLWIAFTGHVIYGFLFRMPGQCPRYFFTCSRPPLPTREKPILCVHIVFHVFLPRLQGKLFCHAGVIATSCARLILKHFSGCSLYCTRHCALYLFLPRKISVSKFFVVFVFHPDCKYSGPRLILNTFSGHALVWRADKRPCSEQWIKATHHLGAERQQQDNCKGPHISNNRSCCHK